MNDLVRWQGFVHYFPIEPAINRGSAKGKALKGIDNLDGNSLKVCYVSPATEKPEKAKRPKKHRGEWAAEGLLLDARASQTTASLNPPRDYVGAAGALHRA